MTTNEKKPCRIWVVQCPFRKDGAPSIGTFGSTIRPIIIMELETWERLCREIPEMATTKFEVGTYE